MKLGVIGSGNMGGAIIKGYSAALYAKQSDGTESAKKLVDAEIIVCDMDLEKLELVKDLPFVSIAANLDDVVSRSEYLLLAVKPNAFGGLVPEIAASAARVDNKPVIISIAAGISIGWLEGVLGSDNKVVRVMPNTPAMVGVGMAGLSRNLSVSDKEFSDVFSVFESIGKAAEVPESLMDTVVGVSGSSPAYAYMYIQALIECAVSHGIPEEDARIFAAQTTMGAAKMVLENSESPEQLRINVCSPGGTTIEAVNVLLEKNFMEIVKEGMNAAIAKSEKMTQ
ncbi:MAG: pyrroline-5-carboxylate reductase [Clostridiales Family XIII bacterium]|jgi:pyrroline-5-carboxylate reductase|nr:pyrroline-5-carboxylate reductase [Clostridiales Family XIII bacterium]